MKNSRRWFIGICIIFTSVCITAQTPAPTIDPNLHVKKEITVGDILTILTIVISLIGALLGLLIASYKDRMLKRKEYADKIRHAAGSVIAKLESGENYHSDILGISSLPSPMPTFVW
jgi:uncharacterized membrane protein